MAELNLRWQAFNDEVLIRRGCAAARATASAQKTTCYADWSLERYVSRTVFWQELAEYSSGSLALEDDPYTPSTHTSLESPRNGGINGYFTSEHVLLQGEPSTITSKWGL
eukprot:SAG25_NODE_26_length_21086_cov_21.643065_19_plen_110_part_00